MTCTKWLASALGLFMLGTLSGGIGLLAFTGTSPGDLATQEPPQKDRGKPKPNPEPTVRLVGEWHRSGPAFGPMLVIDSADAMAKAIPEKETAAAIAKQVDFARERLVGFTWTGGSNGTITFEITEGDNGSVVT